MTDFAKRTYQLEIYQFVLQFYAKILNNFHEYCFPSAYKGENNFFLFYYKHVTSLDFSKGFSTQDFTRNLTGFLSII